MEPDSLKSGADQAAQGLGPSFYPTGLVQGHRPFEGEDMLLFLRDTLDRQPVVNEVQQSLSSEPVDPLREPSDSEIGVFDLFCKTACEIAMTIKKYFGQVVIDVSEARNQIIDSMDGYDPKRREAAENFIGQFVAINSKSTQDDVHDLTGQYPVIKDLGCYQFSSPEDRMTLRICQKKIDEKSLMWEDCEKVLEIEHRLKRLQTAWPHIQSLIPYATQLVQENKQIMFEISDINEIKTIENKINNKEKLNNKDIDLLNQIYKFIIKLMRHDIVILTKHIQDLSQREKQLAEKVRISLNKILDREQLAKKDVIKANELIELDQLAKRLQEKENKLRS